MRMKILVICGSASQHSRTRALTAFISKELGTRQVEVLTFDVGQHVLPLYNDNEAQYQNQEVKRLVEYAQQADGFFITTPEYHNGMTGALKNALDFLGGKHFKNKPVAIAAVAGGGKGGINALNSLRIVIRGLYGLVLPDQFVADPIHFNERNEFVGEDAQSRVKALAGELVQLTQLVSTKVLLSKQL